MRKRTILIISGAVVLLALFLVFSGGGYATESSTDTYEISIDIPRTSNEVLNESVERYVDAMAVEFDVMYGPESFSSEEYDMLGFADGRRYQLSIVGEEWSYGQLSGIVLERYTFTGGAHGATDYIQFLYDDAGLPITLAALFAPGSNYLERITENVRPQIENVLTTQDMYVEEMFETGTAPSEGNYMVYTIGRDGFTFMFQQYQVAPYAAGTLRATVPFEAFGDILNPTYFE